MKVQALVYAIGIILGLSLSAQAQVGISPQPPTQPPAQDDSGSGVDQSNCISAQDMTEIAKSFKQYQNLAGKEFCHDGSQLAYLMAGLNYIRKVQFVDPMVNSPDDLFTGKFAQDWFGYFTKRIKTITIEKNCPQGAVAYVMGFFHQNTMHVCPIGVTNAFSPLDLASIFMHEARHIDGHPHTTCNQGPRAGLQGACDVKLADGGSYAVTVETYSQLAQYGKDIHPAYRAIAQASALIYGAESFQNPIRINTEEAFLAITAEKKIYKIDATLAQAPVLVGQTANMGHLVKNKAGLAIIPDDKNILMTRVFPTGETQNLTLEYNDGAAANRQNVVDYYFGWVWNARVEKNKVKFFCDKRQNPTQSSEVALTTEALSVVYPEGYTPEKNFAYLNTTSGVMQIGCEGGRGVVKPANIRIDSDIKRIHKAKSTLLALTNTGDLLNLNNQIQSNQSQRVDLGLTDVVDIVSYTRATFFDKK